MTFYEHTIGFTNMLLIVSLFLFFIYNIITLKIAKARHHKDRYNEKIY